MAEYIDKQKLIEEAIKLLSPQTGRRIGVSWVVYSLIKQQPKVDVAPVVHAYWEQVEIIDDDDPTGINDEAAKCSNCEHIEPSFYWAKTYYHYCPNCGAKMDKEV